MKRLFLLVVIVAMLLPSCQKIEDAINALDNRVTELENTTIPTINEQIANINTSIADLEAADVELKNYITALQGTAAELQKSIDDTNTKIDNVKTALQGEISTAKADVLAQLEALRTEMTNELSQINSTIATLQAKDTELEGKIAELRTFVDTELKNTKDWATATFSTLEQYNALCSEIATIKTQIENLNKSISELETRLNTKIATDIATAVKDLQGELADAVTDITNSYTSAISTAKNEITAAYTVAIQSAISALETSMKQWVGEQLANYYTIAEVNALLAALELEMNGKLEAQKAYLEGLINELSAATAKSIADNKALIEALRNDVTTLQGESAEHAAKIAENATAISTNAQAIIDNATAIAQNGENIEANEKLIADNKALIEANAKAIAENKSAIEALKSSTSTTIAKNATDITQNASNIAKNAALISQNATAIANNQLAISQNATDIAQLQQDLATTKSEIAEAYKKAISDAINTNNGIVDSKIASEVATINTRISNEVATINNAINALKSRVTALENEVAAIKQQIAKILSDIADMKEDIAKLLARIQSVSYVPKYSDGKATIYYSNKLLELDFLISPKSTVADLSKVWNEVLSVRAVYTQTRAVEFVDMPIMEFVADEQNGVVSLKVSGKKLSDNFYQEQQNASAMLQISDGNMNIISECIPMFLYYDNIQFEDLLVKSICCNNWDTNNDGELSYSEAAAVETVGTVFKNNIEISAFTELRHFTSITKIEYGEFYGCASLCKIGLPKSVEVIDEPFEECDKLVEIYCEATNPPAIFYWYEVSDGGLIFRGESFPYNSGLKIFVPQESYDKYTQYTSYENCKDSPKNWSRYKSYIVPYDFE